MARLAHGSLLALAALACGCAVHSVSLEDFDTETVSLDADPGTSDRFWVRLIRAHVETCGYLGEEVEATVNGRPLALVGQGIPSYSRDFGPQCPAAVFEGRMSDLAPEDGDVTRIVIRDATAEMVFAVRNAQVTRRLELVEREGMAPGETLVVRWTPESDVLVDPGQSADLLRGTASYWSLSPERMGHELRMRLPEDLPAGDYDLVVAQSGEAEVVECTAPTCRMGVVAEVEAQLRVER
jgi:hypothetical protein